MESHVGLATRSAASDSLWEITLAKIGINALTQPNMGNIFDRLFRVGPNFLKILRVFKKKKL